MSLLKKIKFKLHKLKQLVWHKLSMQSAHFFNPTVRAQLKDPKSIPIIIISFNQLYYLKQLIDFLLDSGYTNIVVLDNASTYKPLLDYFNAIKDQVSIHKKKDNTGHLSFWKTDEVFKTYSKGYYAVTDADIVPLAECPDNFIEVFRKLLDEAYDRTKVGFSLKIDDIPDSNSNKPQIVNWERKFWTSEIKSNVYKAEIDTTFALYRPNYNYKLKHFTKGWRTDAPYQARHGGWYIDTNRLTEEQEYYMKTANDSASWQIDNEGNLVNKIHQKMYNQNE